MNIANLEHQLRIDRNNLEEVCCTHPEIYHEVSGRLALLISQRDEAKQEQKEVEAKVDAEIRHDIEVAGDKITEKAVESQKLLDQGVITAKNHVFDLEKQVGQMSALKDAFYARGFAIRDLIQLHIANYYGSDMERASRDMQHAGADTARREQAKNFRR